MSEDLKTLDNELSTLEPDWELEKSLPPAKLRAVNLYLTGVYTNRQIAKVIGVNEMTIGKWLREPEVLEVVSSIQERELELNRLVLNNLRRKAIDTMEDLLDSTMEQVRLGAAKDILDRGGLGAVRETKIQKTVQTEVKSSLEELADYLIDDADVIEIE